MRRGLALGLLLGWLLGIGTALAAPDLMYERQTIVVRVGLTGDRQLQVATVQERWEIIRVDRLEGNVTEMIFYHLRRPRFRLP